MGVVLRNALLCDLDPVGVEAGALRMEGGRIVARGDVKEEAGDEVIDCGGAVVLPGLVNGHTHLYSALAVGMPLPPRVPRNFLEILQLVWWRLDRALDEESNAMSACIGALEALKCGTTTLIDHHASPNAIAGSLDAIERGIDRVGLRGVLCYEVTDRNGKQGREDGLLENRRYILKTRNGARPATLGRFAGLFGAHASFTLDEVSLVGVSEGPAEWNVGVHVHVAEDPCDDQITRQKYGKGILERFPHAFFSPQSIFAHCIHLTDEQAAVLNEAGVIVAHNARSNMNNAVGYAPIHKLTCPIQLGTDGIGADLFAEAKAAWFKSRDGHAGITPSRVIEMLAQSARTASAALGVTVGKLKVEAAGDVVVTDYVPFTPIDAGNFAGHFIFGMGSQNVRHVIADGKVALLDRRVVLCDELAIRGKAREVARDLWERMGKISA